MTAPKVFDRVRETSPTVGAGTYTLSGVAVSGGYATVSDVASNGDKVIYAATGLSGGSPAWEVAVGTYATPSPGTLARTTILRSSNANAAVVWDSGDKVIFITTAANYCELLRMVHKFDAAVPPTSSEDQNDGFHAGSHWLDAVAAKLYVAIDDAGTWLQVLASRFAKIHSATTGTVAALTNSALAAFGIGASASASGAIAFGTAASATATDAAVFGGNDNEASGVKSAAVGGELSLATSPNSVAVGGIATETVWYGESATGGLSSAGKTVVGSRVVMSCLTTNATPSALKFNNDNANGYMTVREGEVVAIDGIVVARSTANFSMWKVTGAIYRNAAGNVTIDDAFTVTLVSQTAGAASGSWALAVSADTANQQPKFDVTGEAAVNITWGANLNTARVE